MPVFDARRCSHSIPTNPFDIIISRTTAPDHCAPFSPRGRGSRRAAFAEPRTSYPLRCAAMSRAARGLGSPTHERKRAVAPYRDREGAGTGCHWRLARQCRRNRYEPRARASGWADPRFVLVRQINAKQLTQTPALTHVRFVLRSLFHVKQICAVSDRQRAVVVIPFVSGETHG